MSTRKPLLADFISAWQPRAFKRLSTDCAAFIMAWHKQTTGAEVQLPQHLPQLLGRRPRVEMERILFENGWNKSATAGDGVIVTAEHHRAFAGVFLGIKSGKFAVSIDHSGGIVALLLPRLNNITFWTYGN